MGVKEEVKEEVKMGVKMGVKEEVKEGVLRKRSVLRPSERGSYSLSRLLAYVLPLPCVRLAGVSPNETGAWQRQPVSLIVAT